MPSRKSPARISSASFPRSPSPDAALLHDPRLRLLRRRSARRAGLGRLRSEKSEKPPPPLLAAGRENRRRTPHFGARRHLTGSARAATRRRNLASRRRDLHPRARRPHPRHRRSAATRDRAAPAHRHLSRRPHLGISAPAFRLLLQDAGGKR